MPVSYTHLDVYKRQALLNMILTKAGREEEAMMTTLAGVIIVLAIIISMVSEFFDTVKTFLEF